jgi:hypothetical protein
VNFELSVPPKVSSPLTVSAWFVGLKETPISFAVMVPCEKRLSVTVGMRVLVSGLSVP